MKGFCCPLLILLIHALQPCSYIYSAYFFLLRTQWVTSVRRLYLFSLWAISGHYHFKYYCCLILYSFLSFWNSYWFHVRTLLSVCCAFLFSISLTCMIPMYLSPGIQILLRLHPVNLLFITGMLNFPILKIQAVCPFSKFRFLNFFKKYDLLSIWVSTSS